MLPTWFDQILNYSGDNLQLRGFEQGINLVVKTPFIIAAVVGVFLNLVLPMDGSEMDLLTRSGSRSADTLPR